MSIYQTLYSKIAKEMDLDITFTEEWGTIGYVTTKNGDHFFFYGADIGLNPSSLTEICNDKTVCSHILSRLGYPSPQQMVYISSSYAEKSLKDYNYTLQATTNDEITHFIAKNNPPFIIKPNKGSQGRDVKKVNCSEDVLPTLDQFYQSDELYLIQSFCPGHEYRLVVLDGDTILAYQKKSKNSDSFYSTNNLSQGAEALSIDEKHIASEYSDICKNISMNIGLRFFGIDLICSNIERFDKNFTIIEINSKPGFKHYAAVNDECYKKVEHVLKQCFVKMIEIK